MVNNFFSGLYINLWRYCPCRSQPQNATVSAQKIAQLLLNIVTFCHGAALQTNHRASCGHVRHGVPQWLYFDCAMQMINNKVRYLST